MKTKITIAALLFCIIATACSRNHEILIFVRDGSANMKYMLENEVGTMTRILEAAGYKVSIATITGEEIYNDSVNFKPDLKLADALIEDYAGFIIPCMAAGGSADPAAVAFTKQVVDKNSPVAAQTNAILILAKAGGLDGRKYAFYNEEIQKLPDYPEFHKGIYSGNGVIRDGNIVTSAYCPWMSRNSEGKFKDCTAELTNQFIAAVGNSK